MRCGSPLPDHAEGEIVFGTCAAGVGEPALVPDVDRSGGR